MDTIEIEPPYVIIKPEVSEEEFYRTSREDSDWEYLDGRLVMHSPASNRHEDLFGFLQFLMRGFVAERRIGFVRGSRTPMRLDERWSPEPDLLFVLEEHRSRMGETRLEGPADWVVEICSKSDPDLDYREKLPRYRSAGIPEVWIVDPFRNHVHVERAGAAPQIVRSGRIDGAVAPGFWIEADWLWQAELPAALGCLLRILGR